MATTNPFKTQPDAACYERLLRFAMNYQAMAVEIYDRMQGIVSDFRMLTMLKTIADHAERGERVTAGDLIGSVQGDDLRQWLLGITWETQIGDGMTYEKAKEEARQICLDALKRLKQEQLEKQMKGVNEEAKAAFTAGDEKKQIEAINRMLKLRRQIKKIKF